MVRPRYSPVVAHLLENYSDWSSYIDSGQAMPLLTLPFSMLITTTGKPLVVWPLLVEVMAVISPVLTDLESVGGDRVIG